MEKSNRTDTASCNKVGYIGFYVETFGTFADIFLKSGLRTDILYWLNSCDCEVIGNIHDKPELFT